MKDNHGWGLSTMIFFCAILAIGLIFSIIMYKKNVEGALEENKESQTDAYEKTYIGLEEDMALSAKEYFKLDTHETKKIVTLKELIKSGNIEQIYDLKNSIIKCSGYVMKTTDADLRDTYDSYLKCGNNYETNGYLQNLDE